MPDITPPDPVSSVSGDLGPSNPHQDPSPEPPGWQELGVQPPEWRHLRTWCCQTPIDGPHTPGCPFEPREDNAPDYAGPAYVDETCPNDDLRCSCAFGKGHRRREQGQALRRRMQPVSETLRDVLADADLTITYQRPDERSAHLGPYTALPFDDEPPDWNFGTKPGALWTLPDFTWTADNRVLIDPNTLTLDQRIAAARAAGIDFAIEAAKAACADLCALIGLGDTGDTWAAARAAGQRWATAIRAAHPHALAGAAGAHTEADYYREDHQ